MPVPLVNSITELVTGQASPSIMTRVMKLFAFFFVVLFYDTFCNVVLYF